MNVVECYDKMGGDYDDVIGRLRKETLVAKFLVKFPEDPSFDELKDSMAAEDVATAFRAAHTLKGVCQNLGLKKLYEPASEMTEALRAEDFDTAKTLLPIVTEEYNATIDVVKEFIDEQE